MTQLIIHYRAYCIYWTLMVIDYENSWTIWL